MIRHAILFNMTPLNAVLYQKANKCCSVTDSVIMFLFDPDKVVVGSFTGMLRIFLPHSSKPDEPIDADSQLLEVQLSDPIIQVEMGKFVS